MKMSTIPAFALSVLPLAAAAASAQCIDSQLNTPSLDRWAYPFAGSPGAETTVPTFGAILQPGFDDRDSQFLLGWDTAAWAPVGLSPDRYVITSATITVWSSVGDRFYYDPTPDSVRSLYNTTDPDYTPDADPGRPVELFAAGWRNGQSPATFAESSPLSPFPPFPPQEGVRSVFAAVYDSAGNATDVSRQVRQRFDAAPMAVGICDTCTPGAMPPAASAFRFHVNVADPAVQAYLARGLSDGRLRFIVSSLEPAAGGPGGGTGSPAYPAFYTRENAIAVDLGLAPHLAINIQIVRDLDLNQDGNVDQDDVAYLVNVIGGGDNPTGIDPDVTLDGNADQDDVAALVNLIAGGSLCP
jgi:hypothetical protein